MTTFSNNSFSFSHHGRSRASTFGAVRELMISFCKIYVSFDSFPMFCAM